MKGVYVITSAQYNANPHNQFLKSIQNYADTRKATIMVIPMIGKHRDEEQLHPSLLEHMVIDGKVKLNNKIQVERCYIRPQQIDPTTGIARFSAADISTIFESSKQRMKVVPNSVTNLPKVLMTTGAVTRPNYNTNNRIGRIASKDHTYGAVVVEIEDNDTFHFRTIKGNYRGQFVDLGHKYYPDGSIDEVAADALVPGDWHVGDTNELVRQATFEMLEYFKPKKTFLHDFFNGHSVSHHNEQKRVTQARLFRESKMTLEDEIEACARELEVINEANEGRPLYLVKSNHDEHLDRFVEEGRYLQHTQNLYMGTKLAAQMVDGIDPLRAGIEMFYQIPSNIHFLSRTDEIKVWGYLMSAHGDKGANGARGNPRGLENAYGKSISGHSHTPEIFRDTIKTGTSTDLGLEYNAGYASSWMNTHAIVYEGGQVQLINIINGKWRMK